MELQRLMQQGLDGLRVFHTFFRRWVVPLAERTRPMWEYSGPMDPDRASPEELPKDEVWSRLDRVLQLRDKNSLEGTPSPLHATKLSNLVCPPFCDLFLLVLIDSELLVLKGLAGYKSWPHLLRGPEGMA